MNRDDWVSELQAERVTTSRESIAAVLARLDMERPESPEQMRNRERLELEADARIRAEEARRLRSMPTGRYTYLEQKLGRMRADALMDEITRTRWWAA